MCFTRFVQPIQLHYDLTLDDVAESYRANLQKHAPGWKIYGLGAVLIVTSLVMATAFGHVWAYATALFGALVIAVRLMVTQRLIDKHRAEMERYRDIRLRITDEAIEFHTPYLQSQIKWSGIVKYLESKNVFLLYQNARVFSMVPKRAFAAGDLEAFRTMLASKVQAL